VANEPNAGAAETAPGHQRLLDAQGRHIRYLRLSLTDRCNFRCSYCSPLGIDDQRDDPLTRPEAARLVGIFAELGVERVRLTGGEPTLRRDLVDVVRDVASTPGIQEVAITTNGQFLPELAGPLRAAGLTRINISLDTLHPEKLKRISGKAATLDRIVRGIAAAVSEKFDSMKLNTVVVKGVNDDELADIARFAWAHGATARFIELMPFGEGEPIPTAEVKQLLEAQGIALEPDATRGWGPAYHMRGRTADGSTGLVGFIGAMTENFCEGCNRVRVGADGSLRACLGGRDRVPLKDLLRAGAPDAEIADKIRLALALKHPQHEMAARTKTLLPMIGYGG
jgi:cyclic pyranopterin phosphate synthase